MLQIWLLFVKFQAIPCCKFKTLLDLMELNLGLPTDMLAMKHAAYIENCKKLLMPMLNLGVKTVSKGMYYRQMNLKFNILRVLY